MSIAYEIRGALPVRADFRRTHARQLAETLANPADVYFATDAVTQSLVLRVRGALSDDEQKSVEDTLRQFSRRWAIAGAIFSRQRYGHHSFVLFGVTPHVSLLDELAQLRVQFDVLLARQAEVLEQFATAEQQSVT
ncbi:hypothetical protein [Paraburkholderia phosphatilytica]|uniref:hypothetical protein n=1 Tax=Paraburkholderia phosphatilytica TaxID=2282883 RepID=UPI000E4FF934|nr:hypothetical protein [Paraburkholderia phosphatilytica]